MRHLTEKKDECWQRLRAEPQDPMKEAEALLEGGRAVTLGADSLPEGHTSCTLPRIGPGVGRGKPSQNGYHWSDC